MELVRLENRKIRQITIDDLDTHKLTWIRVVQPSAEELERLATVTGIPYQEFKESIEEEERPRLLVKRYLELIYRTPHSYEQEGLQTSDLYVYIKNNLFITLENHRTNILDRFWSRCRRNKAKYLFSSHGQFLFNLLDEINDEFLYFIDRIASNVENIQGRGERGFEASTLYSLNITSAYFNQSIIANLEVLNQLRKSHFKAFTQEDRNVFNELYLDKLQILDTEKVQREVIMNLIDIQSIVSTEKLNQTMKRLTALALVIAVPTMISGVYGMNIPLPLSNSAHSFAIITGGMIGIVVALLIIMRRLRWL